MKSTNKSVVAISVLLITICIISNLFSEDVLAKCINLICGIIAIIYIFVKTLSVPGMSDVIPAFFVTMYSVTVNFLSKSYLAESLVIPFEKLSQIILEFLGINTIVTITPEMCISIIFVVLFMLILFLVSKPDKTAMKKLKASDKNLKDADEFYKEAVWFCKQQEKWIESIDRDLMWNESDFTPLDAEIEVSFKKRRKKKYGDLLRCLKKTKIHNGIFLVVGEPGSGKSVALRKLCKELLGEFRKTRKIPLYINLKDWDEKWDINKKPTIEDLNQFVKNYLYINGDQRQKDFIENYYDLLRKEGRWYYIFDSFDELPCLMGDNGSKELIEIISFLLYDYMTSTDQIGGIISSRLSKSPSDRMGNYIVLKIQRFDFKRIRKMLKKQVGSLYYSILKSLYKNRRDLLPLCGNPLYLSLFTKYLNNNGLKFPSNQLCLYESYIQECLNKCDGMIRREGTSDQEVQRAAVKLSVLIESNSHGLEYRTEDLYKTDPNYWEKHLKILVSSGLCRLGNAKDSVSFSHRRFQEYFYVEEIRNKPEIIERIKEKCITNGTGMRDALALYCEVAEYKSVTNIAKYCWELFRENIDYSSDIYNSKCLRLVNVLYFMKESFSARKEVLSEFVDDYYSQLNNLIDSKTDIVVLIAVANCLILLREEQLHSMIIKVLKLRNRWLNDIVLKHCNLVKRLHPRVEIEYINYFSDVAIYVFFERFLDDRFSLSLSKSLRFVKAVHTLLVGVYLSFICMIAFYIESIALYYGDVFSVENVFTYSSQVYEGLQTISIPVKYVIPVEIALVLVVVLLYTELYFEQKYRTKPMHTALVVSVLGVGMVVGVHKRLHFLSAMPFNVGQGFSYILLAFVGAYTISSLYLYIKLVLSLLQDGKWKVIFEIDFWKNIIKKIGYFIKIIVTRVLIISIGAALILLSLYVVAKYLYSFLYWYLTFIFVAAILFLGRRVLLFLKDLYYINRHLSLKTISRKYFQDTMENLHSNLSRTIYAETLLNKRVSLIDNWIQGVRPKYDDDVLDITVAKLDCYRLESYYYLF